MRLGLLADDLVTMAGWHPSSHPHRKLLAGPLSPAAALGFDRTVLAAARKYRAHEATMDCTGDPGPYGVGWMLKALVRQFVWGR